MIFDSKVLLKVFTALLVVVMATAFWSSPVVGGYKTTFTKHVLPIFKNKCMDCHRLGGEGQEKSGLDLSSYETLMKGTKHGPVVVPGDLLTSNLVVLIEGKADHSINMPYQTDPLTKNEIRLIKQWVKQGAMKN